MKKNPEKACKHAQDVANSKQTLLSVDTSGALEFPASSNHTLHEINTLSLVKEVQTCILKAQNIQGENGLVEEKLNAEPLQLRTQLAYLITLKSWYEYEIRVKHF